LLFPRAAFSLTEASYFILAPWYLFHILMHLDAVFGTTWKTRILLCGAVGSAVGLLLYALDCGLHEWVFGTLHIVWSPAPLPLVALACASAVVETVVVQLGIQVRIGGWGGVLAAALFFFAIHVSLNPLFLAAGIALALTLSYTRLPGPVIVAHLAYNALISGFPPA
jgi:hypothetical protein